MSEAPVSWMRSIERIDLVSAGKGSGMGTFWGGIARQLRPWKRMVEQKVAFEFDEAIDWIEGLDDVHPNHCFSVPDDGPRLNATITGLYMDYDEAEGWFFTLVSSDWEKREYGPFPTLLHAVKSMRRTSGLSERRS